MHHVTGRFQKHLALFSNFAWVPHRPQAVLRSRTSIFWDSSSSSTRCFIHIFFQIFKLTNVISSSQSVFLKPWSWANYYSKQKDQQAYCQTLSFFYQSGENRAKPLRKLLAMKNFHEFRLSSKLGQWKIRLISTLTERISGFRTLF